MWHGGVYNKQEEEEDKYIFRYCDTPFLGLIQGELQCKVMTHSTTCRKNMKDATQYNNIGIKWLGD